MLAACATPAPAPAPVEPLSLYFDSGFEPRQVPADPKVLEASEAMRRYLAVDIAGQLRAQGDLHGLVAALKSNKARLKLDYDSATTRTAAEAFDLRAGNCLSLTVMTAALARELKIPVAFHRVLSDPLWTREGNTLFATGHVNILLGSPMPNDRYSPREARGVIIDFTPGADVRSQRSLEITEATITAMYMNNRAAESMRDGSVDQAYWWARGAIGHDPRFLEAVNTLGVIYSHRGHVAHAERAFRHVLAIESENVSALANLAGVLERAGRRPEAAALIARLRQVEPQPPFHFFDLGMAALKAKDYAAARDHFLRELRRNAYYHEAHFALAAAYVGLGDGDAARRHVATALETSTNRDAQNIYSAKLAWLRAHTTQ
jgi:Tfp pilus assembly protein PilF